MTTATKRKAESSDAIDLLIEDHRAVQTLFKDFDKIKDGGRKSEKEAIVLAACEALTIHAAIEEEIFYPAARKAIDRPDMMDEAKVEHAGAKDLIAQLESMKPGDALYDAKFTVLAEQVTHHIKEEQEEMFPLVRKSKLDTRALGAKLQERKTELEGEMAGGESEETPDDSDDDGASARSTKATSGSQRSGSKSRA
jgi:hemerythrin-like domain-containing protein